MDEASVRWPTPNWTPEESVHYEEAGRELIAERGWDAARWRANGEQTAAEVAGDIVPLPPPPPPEPGASWSEVDLEATVLGLLDGAIERPAPTVGRRDDGQSIFYRHRVNGAAGASGSGKSMAVQYVATQEMAAGNAVVYVDLEDDEAGTVGRLLGLGATAADVLALFHYVRPEEGYGAFSAEKLTELVARVQPSLVVIDSTGEAMALDGLDDKDADVARWFAKLPSAIARMGPAVVVIDHVTKADDGTGLWPIGSQRKRAAITGALYMVATIREFAVGRAGAAKLTCAKDRCGNYVRGSKVAEFTVTDEMVANLAAPVVGAEFRPTVLMEKISRYVELNPAATTRRIRDDVPGNNSAKDIALAVLIAEGYIERTVVGQGHQHKAAMPYRESEETAVPA